MAATQLPHIVIVGPRRWPVNPASSPKPGPDIPLDGTFADDDPLWHPHTWAAWCDISSANPHGLDVRHLFLKRDAQSIGNLDVDAHLPGLMLVRAKVTRVVVNCLGMLYRDVPQAQDEVEFLVQMPPEQWDVRGPVQHRVVGIPVSTCIAGEISLPKAVAEKWQNRLEAFREVADLRATPSGFSFRGKAALPWAELGQPARYHAMLQRPGFKEDLLVTLDRERLEGEFAPALDEYRNHFRSFRKLLGFDIEAAATGGQAGLHWLKLDLLNPDGPPQFHWRLFRNLDETKTRSQLRIANGEILLSFSDQRLGTANVPPRSVMTLDPRIVIELPEDKQGEFNINIGGLRPISAPLKKTPPPSKDFDLRAAIDRIALPGQEKRSVEMTRQQLHLRLQVDAERLYWLDGCEITWFQYSMLEALGADSAEIGSAIDGILDQVKTFRKPCPGGPNALVIPPMLSWHLKYENRALCWAGLRISEEECRAFEEWEPPDPIRTALEELLSDIGAVARAVYSASKEEKVWNESLSWQHVDAVYDANQTAALLREAYDLPMPDPDDVPTTNGLDDGRIEPAVLWGLVPTHGGWTSLPVLNVTEEIYLRIMLRDTAGQAGDVEAALFSGVVAFGNDDARLWKARPGQHRFNVSVLDADVVDGNLTFALENKQWKAQRAELTLFRPEMVWNGFLWMATTGPTAADALPQLDNWPTSLRSIPLRTLRTVELFPAPYLFKFGAGSISKDTFSDFATPQERLERLNGIEGLIGARLAAWWYDIDANQNPPTDMPPQTRLGFTSGEKLPPPNTELAGCVSIVDTADVRWTGRTPGSKQLDTLRDWSQSSEYGKEFRDAVARMIVQLQEVEAREQLGWPEIRLSFPPTNKYPQQIPDELRGSVAIHADAWIEGGAKPITAKGLETMNGWSKNTALGETFRASLARFLNQHTRVYDRLLDHDLFRDDPAFQFRPLVWRHHPTLPAVQSLPLTQVLEPPNHPSASRQLVPFELPFTADPDSPPEDPLPPGPIAWPTLPRAWRLGVVSGDAASDWPDILKRVPPGDPEPEELLSNDLLRPAREWSGLVLKESNEPDRPTPLHDGYRFLRLAYLSLPGLAGHAVTHCSTDPSDQVALQFGGFRPAQYHFGLPYREEVQALAQMPRDQALAGADPSGVARVDVPSPRLPAPLVREKYAGAWGELAQRGLLAAADEDPALRGTPGNAEIKSLVEPLLWKVEAVLDQNSYPGTLTLKGGQALALREEVALRGIDGAFQLRSGSNDVIERVEANAGAIEITAGSMAARLEQKPEELPEQRRLRDQRGLLRKKSTAAEQFITTPLELLQDPDRDATLYTCLVNQRLDLGDFGTWSLWFRDLPVRGETFERNTPVEPGPENEKEDVNNPSADAKGFGHLEGYEWRLHDERGAHRIGRLAFFPLTLEKAVFKSGQLVAVELCGRLQLPLQVTDGAPVAAETEHLPSTVVLSFARAGAGLMWQSVRIVNGAGPLELVWPLAAEPGAPQLRIRGIELKLSNAQPPVPVGIELVANKWHLEFELYDRTFSLTLPAQTIGPQGAKLDISLAGAAVDHLVRIGAVLLRLDTEAAGHWLALSFDARWAKPGRPAIVVNSPLVLVGRNALLHSSPTPDWFRTRAAFEIGTDQRALAIKSPGLLKYPPFPAGEFGADRLTIDKSQVVGTVRWMGDRVNADELSKLSGWAKDDQLLPSFRSTIRQLANYVQGILTFTPGESFPEPAGTVLAERIKFDSKTGRVEWIGSFVSTDKELAQLSQWCTDPKLGNSVLAALKELLRVLSRDFTLPFDNSDLLVADVGLAQRKIELAWVGLADDAADFSVLPGMHVNKDEPSAKLGLLAGFATMTFDLAGAVNPAVIPPLAHDCGMSEMLFPCVWGQSLQEALLIDADGNRPWDTLGPEKQYQAVFGSSAGVVDVDWVVRVSPATDDSHVELRLNGMLEVKNSVSWPIGGKPSPSAPDYVLPAVPLDAALDHRRHTARLLLNDLIVGERSLVAASAADCLYTLGPKESQAVQFAAVVEHQFVDVTLRAQAKATPGERRTPQIERVDNDLRLSLTEEARFASPAAFSEFLSLWVAQQNRRVQETENLAEVTRLRPVADACDGWLRPGCIEDLQAQLEPKQFAQSALLVELSTMALTYSRRLAPQQTGDFSPLQHAPRGVDMGIPATWDDYASIDPNALWKLVPLPFVGRLQRDPTEPPSSVDDSQLAWDPIEFLTAFVPSPGQLDLSLDLASRAASKDVPLTFARLDQTPGQWERLDAATLDEQWFRLLAAGSDEPLTRRRLAQVGQTDSVQPPAEGVLAAFPAAGHGRLSQPAVLERLLDPYRAGLPPRRETPPPSKDWESIAWRHGALWTTQIVVSAPPNFFSHGFFATGKRLDDLQQALAAKAKAAAVKSTPRIPAVTLLPPNMAGRKAGPQPPPSERFTQLTHPVSFAISPYLGLRREDIDLPNEPDVVAVFADVLARNGRGDGVVVLQCRLWQKSFEEGIEGAPQGEIKLPSDADVVAWALEVKRRLAPDSPIAIVRVRKILKVSETAVAMAFSFTRLIDPSATAPRVQRARPLRGLVGQLRFREGQYGGSWLPELPAAIELAPPRTADVRPLYLVDPPQLVQPTEPSPEMQESLSWNWGYSGIRCHVQLSAENRGWISDTFSPESNLQNGSARYLWWQACRHVVQFAKPPRITQSLLPKMFRARAIRSMVPALPDAPWPDHETLDELLSSDRIQKSKWQAVLPGTWRWLAIGGRPGAYFSFRHHLTKQVTDHESSQQWNSGSIPVMHRMPRPVPIPPQRVGRQDVALGTWGSWFDLDAPASDAHPDSPAKVTRSVDPRFAPCDSVFLLSGKAAHGIHFELLPLAGRAPAVVPFVWLLAQSGAMPELRVTFRKTPSGDLATLWDPTKQNPDPHQFALHLCVGGRPFPFKFVEENSAKTELSFVCDPNEEIEIPSLTGEKPEKKKAREVLVGAVRALPHGAPLEWQLKVSFGIKSGFDSVTKTIVLTDEIHGAEDTKGEDDNWPDLTQVKKVSLRSDALKNEVEQVPQGATTVQIKLQEGQLKVGAGTYNYSLVATDNNDREILLRTGKLVVAVKGYEQVLTFPVRYLREEDLPLPLQPVHGTFEDPDYSRRLSSQSMRKQRLLLLENSTQAVPVTLAADRREYNPDSPIYLVYAVPPDIEKSARIKLTIRETDGSQVEFEGAEEIGPNAILRVNFMKYHHDDRKPVLRPGQILEFKLTSTDFPGEQSIELDVSIVAEPVNPPPDSAYGLLRSNGPDAVECVRFAWGPQADRIELADPNDLLSEIVRRRAVFRWIDYARPEAQHKYAVQKIAAEGSTRVPRIGEFTPPQ